ncbi:MAG: hypothetical protein HFH06_06150 [Lachnospiraceae bacterium]|jgi:hypothetical protein|nr:hypothetical protein [Lachnospiraceae bacterium]
MKQIMCKRYEKEEPMGDTISIGSFSEALWSEMLNYIEKQSNPENSFAFH